MAASVPDSAAGRRRGAGRRRDAGRAGRRALRVVRAAARVVRRFGAARDDACADPAALRLLAFEGRATERDVFRALAEPERFGTAPLRLAGLRRSDTHAGARPDDQGTEERLFLRGGMNE
jgi:hypothetical protein